MIKIQDSIQLRVDRRYIREAFEQHKNKVESIVENSIKRKLWDWEKQIADSHDITKSDYGFK